MNWSIILFCYNEEKTIEQVVLSVIDFIKTHENTDSEIIIVNDGSSDKSSDIINELGKKNKIIKVINHSKNLGIGKALMTGYENAKKEFVCAVPCDGQFDVRELNKIDNIEDNIFYSFYRENKNYNFYRNSLSFINYCLNRYLLSNRLKDVNWIKVYKRQHIELINIQLVSSLVESEISSKLIKKGVRFKEFPSHYLPRIGGKPKGGNIKTVSKALYEMIKLIYVVWKY
jgi:glycosyltransferase involved in cell wall biosynthesis